MVVKLPPRKVGPPNRLNPGTFGGPVGGVAAVPGFFGSAVVAAVLGAVTVVAVRGTGARVATAAGCFVGGDVPSALRTTAVTARTVAANVDLTFAATVAPGNGCFAVVVHVPGDWRDPQLVVLVWQQPQSCVTFG